MPLGKRRMTILGLLLLTFSLAAGTTFFVKAEAAHSPWNVGNGWGICGGYGTKHLKEIPTEIYPAIYEYFHIPHNSIGAVTAYFEATAVDPKKESSLPHGCTSVPNNLEGTDSIFSKIPYSTLNYQAVKEQKLAKARSRYSGVIPPGATKAIQILTSKYVPWPSYSGHDPYIWNLQVGGNYSLSQIHNLILGYYPKNGWKVVFEYSRSEAPYQGYPPSGS